MAKARRKRGGHSASRPGIVALGTSWRVFGVILAAVILTSGCSASNGNGITLNGDGLHVGTSLAKRDQIAQDKSDAEVGLIVARTEIERDESDAEVARLETRTETERDRAAASIKQSAAMGEILRPVALAIGLAAALGIVALGISYGVQRMAPALKIALDIRKARSFQVGLTVSANGCQATLTANGYDAKELSEIVQGAPLLNAPKLAELQARAGDRGVRALLANGEIETALARLSAGDPYS